MPQISLDIPVLKAEHSALSNFLAQPDAYNDPQFTAKNKRFSELEAIIAKQQSASRLSNNLPKRESLPPVTMSLPKLPKQKFPKTKQS